MSTEKRRVNLIFFKESGKYYSQEEREYPKDLAVYEIVDEIKDKETSYSGMHIVLEFDKDDDIGYPCMILANQRKRVDGSETETKQTHADQTDWVMTDDDSFQIQRHIKDGVYEMYQVQRINPYSARNEYFGVAHSFVSVSEIDIQDVLDCYGYGSLEEIKNMYGERWEGILAECDFELTSGCLENIIKLPDMSWEEAAHTIKELSGYEDA